MTNVTKLLDGSWFAAVLCLVLSAALIGLFSSDSGANAATPTFDRASAQVAGTADLASASSAAVPIRTLPGDITATSSVANAVGSSNPLSAFPGSPTRAVNVLADSLLPLYGSLSTSDSVGLLTAGRGENGPNVKGIRLGNLLWADAAHHNAAAIENVSGDTVQIIDPYVPAVLAGRGSVLDYDNLFGASTAPTYEAWYQAIATTALSNSAFLVLGIVALFAATFVAMWTSDGFSATNDRAARAFGAG